jgi:putative phosphoesterase
VRVGVVSDTHDNLRNVARIVALLNGVGVDRVVHTGDITQVKTLEVLAGLAAPLYGVWGNNDQPRRVLEAACMDLGFDFADSGREFGWSRRKILVVHDPREIRKRLNGHHLVLHGHDHRRRVELRAGSLIVNPGECAGHLQGHNAVAVVDLVSLEAEVLLF